MQVKPWDWYCDRAALGIDPAIPYIRPAEYIFECGRLLRGEFHHEISQPP
jgi:hypothetical protein